MDVCWSPNTIIEVSSEFLVDILFVDASKPGKALDKGLDVEYCARVFVSHA